ncbi:hypothetical protein [Halorussus marinus]|uniref:hypothetical protein n=1 Tax=Halorussus marinus TaxID=2505976 RepID=UPI00106E7A64|nr:hypothetical protein [Halorussus marinus]
MSLTEAFGLGERRQQHLVHLLQIGLAGIVAYSLFRAKFGLVINAGVPLAITFLPAVLARDTHVSMDAGLALWITLAVFVHALGSLGVYQWFPWYDQFAHALSSSVVAGVGYAVITAFDRHSESVEFPPEFVSVFLFVFVMAFGVLWEILEFTTGLVSGMVGGEAVLAQYGMSDIIYDLVFNQVGAIIVAAWGHSRLSGVSRDLSRELDE